MDDPAAYWDTGLWKQLEATLGKLGMKHSCNRWLSPVRVAPPAGLLSHCGRALIMSKASVLLPSCKYSCSRCVL